jgi:UDP-glucuronate 4-epimerase
MKILITGTAGFIGYHLAKKLIDRGDTVIGIDNINDYYDVNLKYARLAETGISKEAENWYIKVQSTKHPNYSFVRMNLEDREQLNQLFEQEKFDKVCNLAAQAGVRYSLKNPHAYINSNIVGFINILEACRYNNIKHLAYASSSSVYGNNTKMPLSTSDNVDHPISLYAATKKSNELMAHTYSHLFGLPTTGLRFFTVYGPWGRPDMALFLFTKAILENKPIQVFNNGNMVRDFTYVDDIVEGVVRVIDSPPIPSQLDSRVSEGGTAFPDEISGTDTASSSQRIAPYKVYNIGNSSPVQLMEYIAAIEKTIGKTAKKEFLPIQPGDVPKTKADVTDLVEELGYKPDTPVKKGIEKFIGWYKIYFSNQF